LYPCRAGIYARASCERLPGSYLFGEKSLEFLIIKEAIAVGICNIEDKKCYVMHT